MTAADIIERVARIVQDSSYTDTDILALINEGRLVIAGQIVPGLPYLSTSDTVTTTDTESSVDLPSDYHKGLFWVGSSSQERRIGTKASDYHNLLTFLEKYPDLSLVGSIEAVCVDGATLLYQGMADDTLTLKYYRLPADISESDTEDATDGVPVEIPPHLHRKLLVSYCCKEIWTEIEDGDDGGMPNFEKYEGIFNKAMAELQAFASASAPREVKQVRDMS